tara:strand:- start:281 stop:871 length:591 start_codon:yes stop_codon:yes gene_type:complete
MKKLNKGAMFGLDARIALAIFGALSVISGAALYSAIQQAKATAAISDSKELMKSLESFYLDTGNIPPLDPVGSSTKTSVSALLSENPVGSITVQGWKGPYTQLNRFSNYLEYSNGDRVYILYLRADTDWSGSGSALQCNNTKPCYAWMSTYESRYSDGIKTKIDEILDNSDGADKGKFRWDANFVSFRGILVHSLN